MAAHNEAVRGDYAQTVLLPGDPERAAWMAETFLDRARCVNRRRAMLGFTGFFGDKPVSIQSTGIGASSFLIYTQELLEHYDAKTLIRVGTCGALSREVGLRSVVVSSEAHGESAASGQVFGLYDAGAGPDPVLLEKALAAARRLGIECHAGLTVCSDIFYHPQGRARFAAAQAAGALAADMETSALYRLAGHFGAKALSICTVVDHIVTGEETDYSERQELFRDMARLALSIV